MNHVVRLTQPDWRFGAFLKAPIEITFPENGRHAPYCETVEDQALDDLRDLAGAIENNWCPFDPAEIREVEVLAQGDNRDDPRSWVWSINDGEWVAVGGCDYTGWDCQSSLTWYANAAEPEPPPLPDTEYTLERLRDRLRY